jgi:hypothetical protein
MSPIPTAAAEKRVSCQLNQSTIVPSTILAVRALEYLAIYCDRHHKNSVKFGLTKQLATANANSLYRLQSASDIVLYLPSQREKH